MKCPFAVRELLLSFFLSFMHERKKDTSDARHARAEHIFREECGSACIDACRKKCFVLSREATYPLLPPPLSPARARSAPARHLVASRDPHLVTFRCFIHTGGGGRKHACVHSFMHERMVDGRKACRVGLPLP